MKKEEKELVCEWLVLIMKNGILAEIIEENQNDKSIKALEESIRILMDKKKQLEDGNN